MIRAYDSIILNRACSTLGRMLDFASRSLRYDVQTMMDLFCASGLAAGFEHGDIGIIAGTSGTELAYRVLTVSGLSFERTSPRNTGSLSPEYWCGYTLALTQWESAQPFSLIMEHFSPQDFTAEYSGQRIAFLDGLPLSISEQDRSAELTAFGVRFSEEASAALSAALAADRGLSGAARLHDARLRCGFSQSGLASLTGIPVRTIQQYEQGQKDLRKARAEYIEAISRVLDCSPGQLLGPEKE